MQKSPLMPKKLVFWYFSLGSLAYVIDDEITTLEDEYESVIKVATKHTVTGIEGDYGGVYSCATYHVQVIPLYFKKIKPKK